ncbi:PA3496 family putative envelope integrity protein [Pontibacter sp. JAM-7]|uniref:PA3496 family putative envelope integrity protein n=1 Tax=Pontibacter sp. JAM-7 TaxID=3366581 RepID=UPI003AF76943
MLRKTQELNQTQREVIDLLMGFEEKEKLSHKKLASRRALHARRAIEQRMEEKALQETISEPWLDD